MASFPCVAAISLEMFSGFAWCLEDHGLHSLNHLHMGAVKIGYGTTKVGKLPECELEKSKCFSLNYIMQRF